MRQPVWVMTYITGWLDEPRALIMLTSDEAKRFRLPEGFKEGRYTGLPTEDSRFGGPVSKLPKDLADMAVPMPAHGVDWPQIPDGT